MSTSSKSVVVEFLTKFEKTIVKPVSRRFSWRPEDNNSLVKVISDVFIIPASSTDLPITVTSHSDSVMTIFNDPDKTSDLTVKINGDTNGNNLSYWRAISGALGSLTVTNANVNSQRILKIYTIIPQGSVLVNDGTVAAVTTNNNKVKVSENDTVTDYLINKLVAGDGITLTETNDASDENLTISSSVTITAISDTYTTVAADDIVVATIATDKTVTLLAGASMTKPVTIKNSQASTGILTVDGNASETIDGSASILIYKGQSRKLAYSGGNLHII